ncbi:NAD(P)-dependent alcohol dehydrogenase [Roseofilum reptotaenium CS-1145]|uniref:alcohol dehydrogenase (NADP(+)) n=1 Tax=Roseofilum reptotaenium AO1-A TaxID=1925591 RepID=A0A1L9QY89_9CYAN|nr:NAD(P)-dependent alcohol dehydrogenase [Roseofilum reptotaenium]MDB9519999.1 NAD(P)-dependent alcohol dehydrogenase [Roseofilum reptotaenium CS-1145]OJJ27609.1 alcohol dehydrogenase [Roseofilum reptotaenium AO1-A]
MIQVKAKAAQCAKAALESYQFEVSSPQDYDCLIKVQSCGLCHSDIHIIDNDWDISDYPVVPGHEVIGEVEEVGSQVKHLKVGDRVGVGWQKSACLQCPQCLKGNENLCKENEPLIIPGPGGFASYLLTDSRFAFPIPQDIDPTHAGPLLCGGITVYSGLRHAGMTSGQEIGIIGVGGLGHMAVQFAHRLGNRVTVFTTSEDKAEFAKTLGADETIVVGRGESPPTPKNYLNILLSTAPANLDWAAYVEYLDADGTLCFVGVSDAPLTLPLFSLLSQRRRIMASPIGGRAIMNEMLNVAAQYKIAPIIETYPLEEINIALDRVRSNQVRYRAVLTMD